MTTTASTPISSNETSGTFRLVVRSADDAVATIRSRWGNRARVLSVRSVPGEGLGRFFGSPRIEVIAEVSPPEATPAAATDFSVNLDSATEADDPILPPFAAQPAVSTARTAAPTSSVPSRSAAATPTAASTVSGLGTVLRRAGFPETLLGRLESNGVFRREAERPLHESMGELGRELRACSTAQGTRRLGNRVAFLGASGVGRSTALCKWLAREVIERARTGTVWRVEFDRPNSTAALDVFCEALGVPTSHYQAGVDTPGEGFTFADLPAITRQGREAHRDIVDFLDREGFESRVLVLNAAYDHEAMQAAYAAGRALGATHLVLTHVDEVVRWGRLWDFLIGGELTPLFLSTGPGLAGDLETDVIGAMLRRTLPAN